MTPVRPRRRTAAIRIAAICAVALVAAPLPATAGPYPRSASVAPGAAVERQIEKHLAAYPGGVRISATRIAYAGGAFVITFTRPATDGATGAGPATAAAADCPSGWFCFYDGVNYAYPRGELSDCGWQDLSQYGWHDRTEAVHSRVGSSVSFINHAAGTSSHGSDQTLFTIAANGRDPDVDPHRNRADHVNRNC